MDETLAYIVADDNAETHSHRQSMNMGTRKYVPASEEFFTTEKRLMNKEK